MIFFVVICLEFASQSISFYFCSEYFFDDIGEDIDDVFLLLKKFEGLSIDDQMQSKERLVIVENLVFEG